MRINEVFGPTVQGEGVFIGQLSAFVRLAGCPVHCAHCDTKRAWDEGTPSDVGTILTQVRGMSVTHTVITGGEPLVWGLDEADSVMVKEHQDDLTQLVNGLKATGCCQYVTVETSGHVKPISGVLGALSKSVDFWSISPKLAFMQPSLQPDLLLIKQIMADGLWGQLKFVVRPSEFEACIAGEIGPLIEALGPSLMCTRKKWAFVFQPCNEGQGIMALLEGNRNLVQQIGQMVVEPKRYTLGPHTMVALQSARCLPQLHVLLGVR